MGPFPGTVASDTLKAMAIQTLSALTLTLIFNARALHAEVETYLNPLPSQHVYQNAISKLGLAGLIYCGPAATTESLAFLKWTRKPAFPQLKWQTDNDPYAQTLEMVKYLKTTPWLLPFSDPQYTDPIELVNGLRRYFKDSGYANPYVESHGFRAEKPQPVTLAEIRESTKKGYGVILLVGYYNKWGRRKYRNGGHYLTVFGYKYDHASTSDQSELIVTDSLLTPEKQPRHIQVTPIQKDPRRSYPDHVLYKIDGDDSVYLDTAIFFIPER